MKQTVVVVGSQWGDEGKGKIVDYLAGKYDFTVRYNGGSNAGHTIVFFDEAANREEKYGLHLLPSGVFRKSSKLVIGNGVIIHIPTLLHELEMVKKAGFDLKDRLLLSDRCHIVLELHKLVDGLQEGERQTQKIGTTGRGIGPCYSDKSARNGIRLCDLRDIDKNVLPKLRALKHSYELRFPGVVIDIDSQIASLKEAREQILPLITDTALVLNKAIDEHKTVLFEGANATFLDIDFGTYPYVTSSHPTTGGVSVGTGVPFRKLHGAVGVVKAYTTRVGEGPFVTEFQASDKLGDEIREKGREYGTTTGRPRRCGWLDLALVKYSHMLNGFTSLNLTKLDVLTGLKELKVCVGYKINDKIIEYVPADLDEFEHLEPIYQTMEGWSEDLSKIRTFDALPLSAQKYVELVEKVVGCPVDYIGVGADRDDMIIRIKE